MISDAAAVVVTGSNFNCTKMAERQSANSLLAIQSRDLTAQYARIWEARAARAEPYAGRGR
jgi:hypothetical protein